MNYCLITSGPETASARLHGLLHSKRQALRASLTYQETRSIHDSMNIPNIEFISLVNDTEKLL